MNLDSSLFFLFLEISQGERKVELPPTRRNLRLCHFSRKAEAEPSKMVKNPKDMPDRGQILVTDNVNNSKHNLYFCRRNPAYLKCLFLSNH
jgi:hypothetical protein